MINSSVYEEEKLANIFVKLEKLLIGDETLVLEN
jgi:hypothetical protein